MATRTPSGQRAWSIRHAQPDDGSSIVDLLNTVYGQWGEMSLWRWKYQLPPAQFRSPSAVAEMDGQIIGHFGILPVDALWHNKKIQAAQTIDAAVLPAFRRRGIHSDLGRLVLDSMAQTGIPFVYAFPGLYSLAVDQRIGYQPVTFVPEMMLVLKPWQALIMALASLPRDMVSLWRLIRAQERSAETVKRLIRLRRSLLLVLGWLSEPLWPRTPSLGHVKVRPLDRYDRRFDEFWNRQRDATFLSLTKDARYLTWRYHDRPGPPYRTLAALEADRLLGYVIQRNTPPYSHICELAALPGRDDVLDALVVSAGQQAKNEGCLVLITWAQATHPNHEKLRRSGFISMRRLHQLATHWYALARRFYQVIIYAQHLQPDRREKLIDATAHWSLALGDSDLA